MKVHELIALLEKHDLESEVLLHCDGEYGFPVPSHVSLIPFSQDGIDIKYSPVVILPSCPD